MRMPRTRRYSAAFTLVEVLVAATILVVMVGFMIVVMDQTTRIWSGSSAKVEQFREARSAFERVSTRLSQATLNTYWDYVSATKPTRYLRQSELRFIAGSAPGLLGSTGPGNTSARVAHTVFFNAPLGITANVNYTGLENALNTIGYFVELGDDSAQRPDFMRSMVDAIPLRWRFRLMEFSQPTENFSLYQWTSGTGVIETGAGDQAALEGCQRSSHWWLARRTRSCAIASALAASHAVPPFLSRAWSTCLCPDSMSPLPMGNSRSIAAG